MNEKNKRKDYLLRKRYDITLKEYRKILQSQKYKCAICGKKQKDEKKAFAVDHNHLTGWIRGLLCCYCNSRLMKYLRDSKQRTIGLIKYLQTAIKEDKEWQ